MSNAKTAITSYLDNARTVKQTWRREQALLNFSEKLAILDDLKAASTVFEAGNRQSRRTINSI
jgi:hypothetical protein